MSQINLYFARQLDIELARNLSAKLNNSQRHRSQSMQPKRLARFVSSRFLLSYLLENSFGSKCDLIDEKGSPPLIKIDDRIVNVSISYSKAIALVALSEERLGVDVEYIKSNWSHEKAALFCCEPELAFAKGLPSKRQLNEFYTRLWVAKEAYCKSLGISVFSTKVQQKCLLDDPRLKELDLATSFESLGAENTDFEQNIVLAVYSQSISDTEILVREVDLSELAISAINSDTKP